MYTVDTEAQWYTTGKSGPGISNQGSLIPALPKNLPQTMMDVQPKSIHSGLGVLLSLVSPTH